MLAIGPLTNIAGALLVRPELDGLIAEVVVVGGSLREGGSIPPFWPFEFNLTKDRWATKILWTSSVPITVLPLDVLRYLPLRPIHRGNSPLSLLLSKEVDRWLMGRHWMSGGRVPAWDLGAAMWLLHPEFFTVKDSICKLSRLTRTQFGSGSRSVRVITEMNTELIWQAFTSLVNSAG